MTSLISPTISVHLHKSKSKSWCLISLRKHPFLLDLRLCGRPRRRRARRNGCFRRLVSTKFETAKFETMQNKTDNLQIIHPAALNILPIWYDITSDLLTAEKQSGSKNANLEQYLTPIQNHTKTFWFAQSYLHY